MANTVQLEIEQMLYPHNWKAEFLPSNNKRNSSFRWNVLIVDLHFAYLPNCIGIKMWLQQTFCTLPKKRMGIFFLNLGKAQVVL